MLSFAWDGITSFSVKPLRAVTVTGAAIACVSFAAIIVLFILMLCGIKISGWTAASVWLACGILMLSTGLVGEYVGKIYSEVKSRPRFFIETVLESASISADTADNDIIRAILSRRSVRKYTSDPVGHELLAKIVECGKFAATAKGIQPWFFSVVESRRILDAISEANRMVMLDSSDENMRKRASEPNFDSFRGAPCAIIVSGMKDNSYSEADCANACENMLIAAESIGLSTCYIASFKTAFESEAGASITKLLKIPDGYSPRFAVAVGYGCENLGERAPRRENITEYIK
ncbi:Undecaprenyl-phosphate 4-deoxy-4-formamido-L-arabinose transferase [bioreactor metagenome]|uniref:Undecaprenyl-phosphate 4-deoxy-4-formamido-L-arabinose transferase n=1 Tax=bioreactor metagenome TaxID=1076179 RepID=A0A645AXG1_9ZZZZ